MTAKRTLRRSAGFHHENPVTAELLSVLVSLRSTRTSNERRSISSQRSDHDVEWVGDVTELGLGADDESIPAYASDTDRLILTQDDDFFTKLDTDRTAGVLFQSDQTLSSREVGNIVHEMAQYVDQSDVTLEYVSRNWL